MTQDGLDAEGYIEISCATDNIPSAFLSALNESVDHLKSTFQTRIHSIYLYGSVATGLAVIKQSDLDILVIFERSISEFDRAGIKQIAQQLSATYTSLVREIGIEAVSLDEVLAEKSLPGLGCFIKHLCVCIEGKDIRPFLPKFRPSTEVAREFNGDYAVVMKGKLAELAGVKQPEGVQRLIRQMSRKTLRAGFCLVMPRLGCWTTDLEASFEYFCRYYPEKRASMSLVLNWTQKPTEDSAEFLQTIIPLADWLALEFNHIINR